MAAASATVAAAVVISRKHRRHSRGHDRSNRSRGVDRKGFRYSDLVVARWHYNMLAPSKCQRREIKPLEDVSGLLHLTVHCLESMLRITQRWVQRQKENGQPRSLPFR